MHKLFLKKYYFINKFDRFHLEKINPSVSIIYRNYKRKTNIKLIRKIKTYCKKRGIGFFLSNNLKLALKLNLDGVYLPAFNNDMIHNCFQIKNGFKLIGSAHNIYELNIKKKQKVEEIFLSPIFKKKSKMLGIYGFLKLKRLNQLKNIVLGGVNKKNLKQLSMINADGYAAINLFEKKKGP